jgi:hypothetical protein
MQPRVARFAATLGSNVERKFNPNGVASEPEVSSLSGYLRKKRRNPLGLDIVRPFEPRGYIPVSSADGP